MFSSLSRTEVQTISLFLFGTGAAILVSGGWSDGLGRSVGIVLMAGSIWFMMMCEASLLMKVQNEMQKSLDSHHEKREVEISELLHFLTASHIASSPLQSMEGAKSFCKSIDYPAMVLTPHHQIVRANALMHKLLGWKSGTLNGTAAHFINIPTVMSKISEIMSRDENLERRSMSTQYVYLHKSGKKIFGQLDAHEISPEGFLEGYFIVFHPEEDLVISKEEIDGLIK